jgi:hypothetical protein
LGAPGGEQRVQHGLVARVLLLLTGALFCTAGAALSVVMLFGVVRAPTPAPTWALVASVLAAGLFVAIALYGGNLFARGVRGFSPVGRLTRPSGGFEDFLRRWNLPFAASLGLVGWLAARGQPPQRLGGVGILLWYWFVGCVVFLLASGPHELGHALAARACGLEISEFRIWPLALVRDPQRRFRPSVNLKAPGDVAGLVLTSTPPRTPAHALGIVIAGPAANALAAISFSLGAQALGSTPRSAHGPSALLWAAALVNVGGMISSLIPRRVDNGRLTDGALLLGLLWRR